MDFKDGKESSGRMCIEAYFGCIEDLAACVQGATSDNPNVFPVFLPSKVRLFAPLCAALSCSVPLLASIMRAGPRSPRLVQGWYRSGAQGPGVCPIPQDASHRRGGVARYVLPAKPPVFPGM